MFEGPKILEMMRITSDLSLVLLKSAIPALASPNLTRDDAETLVLTTARFLSGVDLLYFALQDARQHGSTDPAIIEAAAQLFDLSQEFGTTLQLRAVDRVKRLGGDAPRVLRDAWKQVD